MAGRFLAPTGWSFDPVIEKFYDVISEYLKDQVRWQTGMKEELQKLRDLRPKIQAVILAASQQQIGDQDSEFNKWLWQMRDAIDDADDVLDEFEYLKYKKKVLPTTSILEGAREIAERAVNRDARLKRLEQALQKLVEVSAEVSDFLGLLNVKNQEQQEELNDIRETGATPTNNLVGLRDEMEFIMKWLKNSSNEDQSHSTSANIYKNISLLSIVGHGGMGKTTLLQHVYNKVMEKEFDVKMWVFVSPDFNVKKVIAGMVESHTMSKCELITLDPLQESLKSVVMDKKFLLVLDDIWGDEENDKIKWRNVFASLAYGSLGSKILVTTRMNSVASMIARVLSSKDHKTLRLDGLKDDECLELLNNQAFAIEDKSDANKKSKLEQIVRKVFGSPLVAKVIGGVLSLDMGESHWKSVSNKDIESIIQVQSYVFPILRLSYMVLPKHLQNCFAFCSIFSQYHEFDKDDLIRMWIALNFIQQFSAPRETMEDIGKRYFDTFIKKSFFEKFQNTYTTYYKMHDLLHKLAHFDSAREYYRFMGCVGDNELPNCETIRHLSVKTEALEVLRKIKEFKKLRSLFLFYGGDIHEDFANVLSEIFETSSSIRLLFINSECQMPNVIGGLIHLRYLKWDNGPEVTRFPRSICNLYHMNFIIYNSQASDFSCEFLPRDMNNLFNLRYAELPWKKLPKMHWIGELHPLQRLNNYFVKEEAGYRINELEHMNELRELRIYQLENVKDAQEACSAKFCDKRNLKELSLYWGDDLGCRKKVHSHEKEVFDNLRPQNNLKQLTINAYMGMVSATWMNDVSFISNLELIKLEGCLWWQTLPPFGQLHFLKSLCLRKMPKVKSIDYEFPSLEMLHIEHLDALERLPSTFSSLMNLHLSFIPLLTSLPDLPPSLEELSIKNLELLQAPSSLSTISSLKGLCIDKIPLLQQLPDLPPSLEELSIKNLESLQYLPSSLSTISSLKSLCIDKIPLLQQLPDLPSSLEYLSIKDCHEELRKRYDKIYGFDRDKVAHIRDVYFT